MSNLSKQLFASVGSHFVTMSCVRRSKDTQESEVVVFSGFLIEVLNVWFWITAGHIYRNLQTKISEGYVFDVWRLDDQTAGNEFNGAAIPFDFEPSKWVVVENEDIGLDYAAVYLHPFFCRQLEAGNARPIPKSAWGDHTLDSDQWALLGMPDESVTWDKRRLITGRVTVLPIAPTEPPPGAGKRANNQFYARLTDLGTVSDVSGMSGGPVFSLKKVGDEWRYHVIGVQAGWYPSQGIIAACPFSLFALELTLLVQSAMEDSPDE